jgi:hypothetical protein
MPYIGTGRISLFFEEGGSGGIPARAFAAVAKVGAWSPSRALCYATPAAASSRVGRRNSGSNTLVAIT